MKKTTKTLMKLLQKWHAAQPGAVKNSRLWTLHATLTKAKQHRGKLSKFVGSASFLSLLHLIVCAQTTTAFLIAVPGRR